jgi:hypothetical protein
VATYVWLRLIRRTGKACEMLNQLWGPVWDLVGNGGYHAVTFSWFFFKISNLIEIILVVLIFVVGMFVNLPGRKPAARRHGR